MDTPPITASEILSAHPLETRIEDLIKEGELGKAMQRLESFFNFIDEERNSLLLLQSNNSELFRLGTVAETLSGEEKRLQTNKITYSFIKIIDDLKTEITEAFKVADIPVIRREFREQKDLIEIVADEIVHDRYDDVSFIGHGDSGWCYRTKIRQTKQDVVMKVLKIMRIDDLLQEELDVAIKLKHRNIIKIVDKNFERLPAYIMLEYVNGAKLDEALKIFGGFPVVDALDLIYKLIDAFNYIRDRRIIHANIRPSKIFIDNEGEPMISAFDIIKADRDDLRSTSRFKEESRYLSPEALSEKLDWTSVGDIERSDQFSLGLLLLELISGKPLFRENTVVGIFDDRRDFFKNPSKRIETALEGRHCDDSLIRMLKKMLAEDPKKRFKDLSDVLKELDSIYHNITASESPLLRSYHECSRRRLDLTEVFYRNLFQKLPNIANDFKNLERQQMMLRFAVCVVFEIERKEAHFLRILAHSSHSKYDDASFYKIFLETLRDTVKDLLGDDWNEQTMPEAWNEKIQKTLAIVERYLQESKQKA